MKTHLLIFTLAVAFLGGCRTTVEETRESGAIPVGAFMKAWASDLDVPGVKAFYLEQDLLFVYGEGNLVVAYDLNGGLKFRVHVGETGDVVGRPIVQTERIIIPTSSALEVFSRQGVPKRSLRLDYPIRSPGVAAGETVFAGVDSDEGGRIAAIALDRQYNLFRWSLLAGGIVNTRPVLFDGALYFATEAGEVTALTEEGILLWPRAPEMPKRIFHTDDKIRSALTADESGIYVPSADTKLYCLEPNTGKIRWQYFAGAPVNTSAMLGKDSVYLFMEGQGLVALDKKHPTRVAKPRWVNSDAVKALSDDAQNVYVLTGGGSIVALDKKTGAQRFASSTTGVTHAVSHLSAKDNTAFVIVGQRLVAVKPVTRGGEVGEMVMIPFELEVASR